VIGRADDPERAGIGSIWKPFGIYVSLMSTRLGLGAACLLAVLSLSTGTPSAAIFSGEGCKYVEAGPPGPKGNRLLVVGYGEPQLRRKGDALVVREGPIGCGRTRVPVDSVDRVVIKAEGSNVAVDERGGRFGPGATLERDGSEIEIDVREAAVFRLYRGARDSVTRIGVGADDSVDFNLNPAGDGHHRDSDVLIAKDELERIKVFAGEGDDLIDSRRLTGIPDSRDGFPVIRLAAGPGQDGLLGGREGEALYDGPGDDLVRAAGGDDYVGFGPGRDTVYGGRGDDALVFTSPLEVADGRRDPADRIFAGPGADVIQDDNGYLDLIRCGPGRDLLDAHGPDRGRHCEKVRRGRGDLI
jgi:hypothetical protein